MTYTIHDPRAPVSAVITRLAVETGKNIGDGEAPADITLPYAVVYPFNENQTGSLNDGSQTALTLFQVSSVGSTLEQAQWMATAVRTALLGWKPTIAGKTAGPVEFDAGQPGRRDDTVQPPRFVAVDRFSVFVAA